MGLTLRKAVLQSDGYSVIGVSSAEDALAVLREASISVTIADHMLRGTTGVELAKKMKAIKPHVPIILFSGTLPERLEGVDVYIHKGEPTTEFLRIVREVVERFCS
jgi:DNA-binding NtrC family response regulator